MLSLQLVQHFFGQFRGAGCLVEVYRVLAELELMLLPAQALVIGGLHDPLGKRRRFAQLWETGKQIETNGLEDIGGVIAGQAKLNGNREDEVFVLIDQGGPGALVTLAALPHQALVSPREFAPGQLGSRWASSV
jgi:hypothetical protein